MSKEIFEDMQQAPAVGAGGAKAKLEKQARQLAYDTKYKVKQALSAKSGGKADPAAVAKMYLAQLAKSPAPPAVKALAKKKLMGEEYVDVKGFVVDSVTDALLKVFVEKKEETVEEVIEEEKGEQKFHIKVTDKKTGNTYHRYATRAKIAELRANPNIATVEMSHQGESKTKAKKDYDGDGKVESPSKEHAGAVHNAIQRSKGGTPDGKDTRKEEVEITEKKHEESKIGGGNLKKLSAKANKRIDADVDGDVDTDDMKSDEMGEFVPSADGKKKIKTKVQKEDYLSNWREEILEGKDEEEIDKEVDVMKGKNKVKVMPELGESAKVCEKCGKSPCECDKEDPRGMKTKVNLMRNKLRAMGLKMSHELDGETIEEMRGQQQVDPRQQNRAEKDEKKKTSEVVGNMKKVMTKRRMLDKQKFELQKKGKLPLTMSNEVEGETLDETPALALKLGLAAGTAIAGTKIGQAAINKVQGMVQKKRAAEAPYKKLLNQETEVEGETVSEEDADRMKDRRMERGGVGGNQRYDRAPKAPNTKKFGSGKTMAQKEMEKKYGKGASAMDIVKAQIRAKHGKDAIMDTKKKK